MLYFFWQLNRNQSIWLWDQVKQQKFGRTANDI